jgi:hypothetical protein
MRIDRAKAETIAQEHLAEIFPHSVEEVGIDHRETIEKEYGWIFFYNTKQFLETGNMMHSLGGNAPLLVEREGGALVELPTYQPLDDSLREYEETRRKGNASP